MKSILISIKPKWIAKILNGEKTILVLKTAPKCELPTDVYIYCTKTKPNLYRHIRYEFFHDKKTFKAGLWNGMIVAKFTLKRIDDIGKYAYAFKDSFFYETLKDACLTPEDLTKYAPVRRDEQVKLYAWHIEDLVIFDEPKELSEFHKLQCNQRKSPCNIKDVFGVKECHGICKLCKPLAKAPVSWQYIEV